MPLGKLAKFPPFFLQLRLDWQLVALVIDRLMLTLFSTIIVFGTLYTWFSAPSLTDYRVPITDRYPPKPLV
jgi:hypothetical protein